MVAVSALVGVGSFLDLHAHQGACQSHQSLMDSHLQNTRHPGPRRCRDPQSSQSFERTTTDRIFHDPNYSHRHICKFINLDCQFYFSYPIWGMFSCLFMCVFRYSLCFLLTWSE